MFDFIFEIYYLFLDKNFSDSVQKTPYTTEAVFHSLHIIRMLNINFSLCMVNS